MKKFIVLCGALFLCALTMNASPYKGGALTQYSEQALGEARVKDGLTKAGRCPELCEFISDTGITF